MSEELRIIERIEERLQNCLGSYYEFKSDRQNKRNTLVVNRENLGGRYAIEQYSLFSRGFSAGGIKEIGYILYAKPVLDLANVTIYIGDENKLIHLREELPVRFMTKLKLSQNGVISRNDKLFVGSKVSPVMVLPSEMFNFN